ncbi:MAG: hypothetical protein M8858_00865 [marine benthic group bacterium]|nr:hypothetical protein [Gemmatimonadota bacterium]
MFWLPDGSDSPRSPWSCVPRTYRSILLFWLPLAATWLMMAAEGPFLAAVIARLADPKFNLAAFGVAFAIGILVEAPVIMLMSAATALVEDRRSYVRLRNFGTALGVLGTVLLALFLVPPLFQFAMYDLLGLETEVAELVRGALWLLLPWPGTIGYRRFIQGVLIRSGRTRLVAIGTVIRLVAMSATALALYWGMEIPGAWVGAAALSVGVTCEAFAARWMARSTIRELLAGADASADLTYSRIAEFYLPLALTSFIGLAVQPMLTFFMGRAPLPLESLALFPVVNSLSFIFRSLGLSFQDAAIALMGERHEHAPELARFGLGLGLAASAGLGLIALTPLAYVWFGTISGLTPELTTLALTPTRVLVPLPAISVLLSYQRAILIKERRTKPITVATAIEVGGIALLFMLSAWGFGLIGVTSAFVAFVGGRLASNLYLAPYSIRVLRHERNVDL